MTSAWPDPAAPQPGAEPPAATPPAATVERLRAAGCVFAEEEAALLLAAAEGPAELDRLVRRRVAGEPLEHLLGWAEFAGLRIAVGPGVFVPRRRSELLVRLAAEHLAAEHLAAHTRPAVLVDLCCGSGALGAGVAAALGRAGWTGDEFELHAADLDPRATVCARRNLAPWGARVHTGDLFAALPAALSRRVDVLMANAPYVPTAALALLPPEARDHEPVEALDGGADGLDLHRRIAAGAPGWLAPGGVLVIEVGQRQMTAALGLLAGVGLRPLMVEDSDLGALAIVAAAAGR